MQRNYAKEYVANREKSIASALRWQRNNRARKTEYNRKWSVENKERCREYSRNYRKRHPEKVKANLKKHRSTLKWREKHRLWQNRRRARYNGFVSVEDWKAILLKHDNMCAHCKRNDIPMTQDHIIPLALGGKHEKGNLQPLCKSCNCRKGARHL